MPVATQETAVASVSLGSSVVAGSACVAQVVRDVAQAQPCVVSLDGSVHALAATRAVFGKAELLEAVEGLTYESMPTQPVQVSPTLLELVTRVPGVARAEWATDYESIEVTPVDGLHRAAVLMAVDEALRAEMGDLADSVVIALQ